MIAMDENVNIEGDLVLIYHKEKPSVYARIEDIRPDVKKDWYRVTLLFLTIPARTVTWILREEYINGVPYTMGGDPMRLEKVKQSTFIEKAEDDDQSSGQKGTGKSAKVIPFKREG